ncbi:MAG TPA: CarD family transcriptional regulator [Pyrinomonadaceae bacterium]|nr:CarD family transcriptional regulator [Pyrinomonadaceae bacterium]
MDLSIGEKVAYPNQGICLVEDIEKRLFGANSVSCYFLRVLRDNSIIFVPTEKAELVGIRPIIGSEQSKNLLGFLAKDFEDVAADWKIRSRDYSVKLQSGDVFEAADVLKKLSFLSREKKLSFREQTFLEKAKFLVVSEIANAILADEDKLSVKIDKLVNKACEKHCCSQPRVLAATNH